MVKCRHCKKSIDKTTAYSPSPKIYYCSEECFNEQKNKFKPDKSKNDGTPNPRRVLTDFIQSIYLKQGFDNSDIPWTLITSVLKNIMDTYTDYEEKPYSYGGIKYCLWYMKEVEEINLFGEMSNTILALVPFNYDKSKKYFYQCQEIKKMVKEFEFDDKIITIKKSGNIGNRVREIDIDSL